MLIGLSGGIGSGKSTVARHLHALGAAVIDADQIAREVVAPDSPGLAAVAAAFGNQILNDGALDREVLGRIVFADPGARQRLESITHPLIAERTRQLVADLGDDAIVVHEIPLLVELHREAQYHLTIIVLAHEDIRAERLRSARGMSEVDARARIAAQADDTARRAAADVVLCNESGPDELRASVEHLWPRIEGFAQALHAGQSRRREPPWLVPAPARLGPDIRRLAARVADAAGAPASPVGSAALGDDPAPDVAEVLIELPEIADATVESLRRKGFPPVEPVQPWGYAAGFTDPGRPARVHVHRRPHPAEVARFDELMAQAAEVDVAGWDFSWFDGRATEARPPWGYSGLLAEAIGAVESVVDLQTGGGEVLASALRAASRVPKRVCATESWAPNVPLARAALAPYAGQVLQVADDARIPLVDGSVELVASRHPTVTDFTEIARVLTPAGRYLSQQIGPASVQELTFAMIGPYEVGSGRDAAQLARQAAAAGLQVRRLESAALPMTFDDAAAVAVFLRKVPWIVPGFTIDGYRESLWRLHCAIDADGPLRATSQRILIDAHAPLAP